MATSEFMISLERPQPAANRELGVYDYGKGRVLQGVFTTNAVVVDRGVHNGNCFKHAQFALGRHRLPTKKEIKSVSRYTRDSRATHATITRCG